MAYTNHCRCFQLCLTRHNQIKGGALQQSPQSDYMHWHEWLLSAMQVRGVFQKQTRHLRVFTDPVELWKVKEYLSSRITTNTDQHCVIERVFDWQESFWISTIWHHFCPLLGDGASFCLHLFYLCTGQTKAYNMACLAHADKDLAPVLLLYTPWHLHCTWLAASLNGQMEVMIEV